MRRASITNAVVGLVRRPPDFEGNLENIMHISFDVEKFAE
jgi:hypothetical protein